MILFSPLGVDWHDRRVLVGNGCVVLGAIVWSISLLQVRGHRWHADPIQLMPLQTLVGALVSLPFAVLLEGPVPPIQWSGEFVAVYAWVVILATCVPFWALVTAGRSLPAIAVSLAQLATPVLGVLASAAVVAEVPGWADIAGLVLIVLGVAVAAIFGRRAPAAIPVADPAIE
jgi:drug/metabolite transporter (DMT)-like permease